MAYNGDSMPRLGTCFGITMLPYKGATNIKSVFENSVLVKRRPQFQLPRLVEYMPSIHSFSLEKVPLVFLDNLCIETAVNIYI